MGFIENERKDGVDNDDVVFVIREKDSGYFFKSGDGRHWVKQINKASTFSSINSEAIKRHVGESRYVRGESDISREEFWTRLPLRERSGYKLKYVVDFEKYEIVPVRLEVAPSNNALDINQKSETDLSEYFKYDIGDVVVIGLGTSLREIKARSVNFFKGGFEVKYTAKCLSTEIFHKIDQCDIIGVKE